MEAIKQNGSDKTRWWPRKQNGGNEASWKQQNSTKNGSNKKQDDETRRNGACDYAIHGSPPPDFRGRKILCIIGLIETKLV